MAEDFKASDPIPENNVEATWGLEERTGKVGRVVLLLAADYAAPFE